MVILVILVILGYTGLSSITTGTCIASLGGCLPPRPQGIVELTLSLSLSLSLLFKLFGLPSRR